RPAATTRPLPTSLSVPSRRRRVASYDQSDFAARRPRTCPKGAPSPARLHGRALDALENRARREGSAAAHRDERRRLVGPLELVEGGGDQAAPGGADRVAQGDGAPVDVDLLHVGLVDARPRE